MGWNDKDDEKKDKPLFNVGGFENQNTYDSDTDLSKPDQDNIANAKGPWSEQQARKTAWQNAGPFDKLKSYLKARYYGDTRGVR